MISKEKIWSIVGVVVLIAAVATVLMLRNPWSQQSQVAAPKTTTYSINGVIVAIGKDNFTLKQAYQLDHGDTSKLLYSDRKVTFAKDAKLYAITSKGSFEIKTINFYISLKIGETVSVFLEGDATKQDYTSEIIATRVNVKR